MKIKHLSLVTSEHSVTMNSRESAPSPYGPVRAGLTTSPITQDQRLSELLSSLESKVETLESRYLEVLNILTDVMAHLVKLSLSTINEIITDETT